MSVFNKLIAIAIISAAKNGININLAILAVKARAIDEVASLIEKQLPFELPFSVRDILNGGSLPSNVLSPQYINFAKQFAPPIPEPVKAKALEIVTKIEEILNTIIGIINTIKGTLALITIPLNTIESVASTVNGMLTAFEQIILVLKAIPLPLGAPVGVGVPANVPTGFSDGLDQAGQTIDALKPPVAAVPDAVKKITKILNPILEILIKVDVMLFSALTMLIFIKSFLQPGPVSQEDIDEISAEVNGNIQESKAVSPGAFISSSDDENNKLADDALLILLDPNSINPYMYRGFRLIIQHQSELEFQLQSNQINSSLPSRRISATRIISKDNFFNETGEDIGVTLYSGYPNANLSIQPKSTFSFSSSTQVLVEEAKFNIDQYLREFTGEDEEVEEEDPIEVLPEPTPLQTLEELVAEARQNLRIRGFTPQETEWVMEYSNLLVQNIIRQMDDDGLTKVEFFKQYLINMKGFSQGQADYLINLNSAYGWIVFIQSYDPNKTAEAIVLSASNIYRIAPYTGS